MSVAIILLSFLPFLYYATKDNLFHFRGRQVSLAEHLLHLAIGIALAIVVVQAVAGTLTVMVFALMFFVVAGGLDEYIWHRGLPEEESDLHAKEHLALLIFIVVTLVVHWLDDHGWRLPDEVLQRIGATSATPAAPLAGGLFPASIEWPWWRAVVLPCCLLPYACFGLNDNLHHIRHRDVGWPERILHLAIVLSLFTVIPHAVLGNHALMLGGLVLFLVARSLDEWIFHRNIPACEAEMHAKTHFAFLGFVVAYLAVESISGHGLI